MKIGILNRITGPDLKKILDAVLVMYLVLVTFYGKLFLPIHTKFFDRYPLIFPLLIILIFKAVLFSLKIAPWKRDKTNNKRIVPKPRGDATVFYKPEGFNALPKKHYLTAILILLTVFCVKSYIAKGITSHVFHPDEEIRITDLLKMLNSRSLDYERYNQPPLFYYTNFVIFSIYYNLELRAEYGTVGNVPYYRWYEFGRQINAAYGALFAAAVFILCYQIFGFMYGLLASFAALISPLRLNIDSLFRTQPASDFWVVLVFIILISLLRKPKTIKFALLGILTSLAICSFFIKLVIALPIGIFLLFCMIRDRRWTKEITIFAVSFLLVTTILMIPPIKNPDEFREKLQYQSLDLERSNKNPTDLDKINSYRSVTFWTQKDGVGYGIFALATIGIVIGLMKRSRWCLYVYSMIAAHYLLIGSFQRTYNRYSAFLIPFYFLFAFLALETVRSFIEKRKWIKEKIACLLSGLIVTLCLIPFIINLADVMKDTARPHNLDLFLEWRESNHKVDVPALSLVRSIKLKGWGVVVIPEKYLIRPNWENLSNFITKRYKILLYSNRVIEKYFKDWKIVKSFDARTGKGGTFYILENSVPAEKLKKDTQLTIEKIPKSWRRL
jgi:hypothetical protein